MEKELTQEILYEEILQDVIAEPQEIEHTFFIDATTDLPKDFPDIKKYVKALGTDLIDIRFSYKQFRIIFEGGEVQYYKGYNHNLANFDEYQISGIVLYGATAEPGVRSLGTSKFDTHLYIDILNNEYLNHAKPDDLLYTMENGNIMKITIEEPEDTNIKDWWRK